MTVLTVLIKITEHRLIHMGVVLKSWSKALNSKPFGYKFGFKLTYQKLCFCMKISIMLQDPPSNLQFNLLLYFEDLDLSFCVK